MNGEYPENNPLKERLDKLRKLKEIAVTFREENLSLPLEESKKLKELEETVLECTNYGWQIDSMLEDEVISPYEYEQISMHLEKINDLTLKLAENHKENARILNKILKLYRLLRNLIKEVNLNSETKEVVYVIEENSCCEVLEEMIKHFSKDVHNTLERSSRIERELINLIKVVGSIENEVVLNVLYFSPTTVMDELFNTLEVLRILLEPIHTLLKARYFREELKTAKIGLELISDDETLQVGETLKIRGLFSSKKTGTSELEEISEILNL